VLTKGAPGIGYVVAATAILGAATILWSLRDGEAGNLMFDGGSICKFSLCFIILFYFSLAVRVILLRLATSRLVLYGTAIAIYVKSVLPSMFVSLGPLGRRDSLQLIGIFTNFVALPPDLPGAKFPPDLRAPTLGLASSHLICSVALTGVLALQTGRWWAERADDDVNTAETLSAASCGGNGGEKDGSRPEAKVAPKDKDTLVASAPST
jgi:hypothetical protein